MKKTFSILLSMAILTFAVAGMTALALPHATATVNTACEIMSEMPGDRSAVLSAEYGTFGDGIVWSLNDSGTLTVSGTGEMPEFWDYQDFPWYRQSQNVKEIVIKDGITKISEYAFRSCYNVKSVVIPDSVKLLFSGAFYGCKSLETVSIGKGLEDIQGSGVFEFCPALKNIIVDSENEYFANDSCGALYNKDKTQLVRYPSGRSESTYKIANSVEAIRHRAFEDCVNLKSITFPDSLRSIDISAFFNCTGLEKIELPNNVEYVGSSAFNGCLNLKSISFGEYVNENIRYCFGTVENLETIYFDPNNPYYSTDSNGVLYNKDKTVLIKYPSGKKEKSYKISDEVLHIDDIAFNGNMYLESVVIPDSVRTIGERAFYHCEKLENISIGSNVSRIGRDAFTGTACYNSWNNDNWENNWSDPVFYIGDCLIEASSQHYGEFVIKEGTRVIADSAVYGFSYGFTKIVIPDSVEHIGAYAFNNCQELTDITVSDNIKTISESAFDDTGYFSDESNWDNNILYIGDCLIAVKDYDDITSTEIKNGTRVIADYVFAWSSSLENVVIPDSVITIGDEAFAGCYSIKSIKLGSNVTSIGDNAFYNCGLIEEIVIPDSVKYIGNGAFSYCEELRKLTFGKNVQFIGGNAFYNCTELESLDIPDSVKFIGEKAFYCCRNVTVAKIGLGVTKICQDAFGSIRDLTIHGYEGSAAHRYANDNDIKFVALASNSYTVSYDAAGGSGAPEMQIKEKNKTLILSSTAPVRKGFTFMGWATENGGKVKYAPGAKYTENKSVTLYAVWQPKSSVSLSDKFLTYVKMENGVLDANGLYVRVLGDRKFEITVSGITVKDKYVVNRSSSDKDSFEYDWNVELLTDSDISYSVSTASFAFNPGRNEEIDIQDMQHSVWLETQNRGTYINDAQMSHTSGSITWVFTIPYKYNGDKDCPFDLSQITGFEVRVRNIDNDDILRTYLLGEEQDLTLANRVVFTPLTSKSLAVGKTLTLSAMASRKDGRKPASTKVVYEIVSGHEHASLDTNGKLKGISPGEVVIRASAEKGTPDAFAEITITICVPATKVTLNITKATMIVGGKDLCLEATLSPSNHTDTLTWSVDKENIATVDQNGVVTAVSQGKATVSATTGSGKKATCSVTVGVPATKVEFSSLKSTSLAVGKTLSLSAKASRDDKVKPVSTNVIYEIVSGHEYASLDSKGKLKGISTGEVVIRATAEAGTPDAFAEITINVCVPATKITLNITKATMIVGGKDLCLEAVLSPSNHTDTLTWSVDKESVATVDQNGVVTAVSQGKATVSATTGSGKKATCSVTVGVPATKVEFSSLKSTSLAVGKTLSLSAKASRDDKVKPVSTNVIYEIVSGHEYASLDSKGKLKGILSGEVVVRATAEAGTPEAFAEITINVCVPATKITLNITKATMIVGGKDLCLEATLSPSNHTDTLTWSVDKENIATVDQNGVVTAVSQGKATVSATTGSGKKATCSVTVGVPATKVEFSSLKSTSLAVGKTLSLSAKASRDDKVKPVSSNVIYEIVSGHEYASLDSKGKLKGISTGEVVVRATAEAGTPDAFAEITINVCVPITSIKFSATKLSLYVGDEVEGFIPTVNPENHSDTIVFYSSDENVVSVDSNGNLKAVSTGTAKIYAQSGSGKKAYYTVKVLPQLN